MCNRAHRHSLLCIIPPDMLRHMAEHGSAKARKMALDAMALDGTMRAMRLTAPKRAPSAVAQTTGQKNRAIYDAKNSQRLPGTVVRREGEPATKDVAVNEAYDGLGATYDFFDKVYGRDSIDDDSMPLDATVHFGRNYDNAFWNGQQMVFGDGDGEYFNRFTISLDVIGHELAHGVTEDEAGLIYSNQPGALNESMSDVFGSLVKQYKTKKRAKDADWLIGAGLFTNKVKGVALRSMKAPGTAYNDPVLAKDPQPAHMRNYVNTMQDNGGVHINSGIPNHAFYQVAVTLGDYAWQKAGRIWYETLRDSRLRANASFQRFARLTEMNAQRLYGATSNEVKVVRAGWKKVGITL
jgi:Zn-dependent metalloprotease